MSYEKLKFICGQYQEREILKKFCKEYKEKEIKGLYYFAFSSVTNTTAIVSPGHKTDHEATCFLLDKKYSNVSINTVLSVGKDIKKFKDFLLIWNISLESPIIDFRSLLVGFIIHLRVLSKFNPNNVLEWSYLTKIPMHQNAKDYGRISNLYRDRYDLLHESGFESYSLGSITKSVTNVLMYLEFLKKRTYKYEDINLKTIPVKNSLSKNSILGGTLGEFKNQSFDIKVLLQLAKINTKSMQQQVKELKADVFSEKSLKEFFELINYNDYQNILLFSILKCFGLRRAEAALLKIKVSILPENFYEWEYNDAIHLLENSLDGDIQLTKFNFWACSIIDRDNPHRDKKSKSINRKIRLLNAFMTTEQFSEILLNHLQERQFYFEDNKIKDHGYLFYSTSNRSKLQPIKGEAIYKRYNQIIEHLSEKHELKKCGPHTFRHYFATYLISTARIDINDVSSLLGHSDVEITRKTYLHYLPNNKQEKSESASQAEKMLDKFKE